LIAPPPREGSSSSARSILPGQPLLSVRDLRVEVAADGALRPAVDGVSFEIAAGESVALVGESGSGKTLMARALVDLLPEGARRTGTVAFQGRELPAGAESVWGSVRGRGISLVFQEPASALDPVRSVGSQIEEALAAAGLRGRDGRRRARELLAEVAFSDPDRGLAEYPHRLSGGQRQRAFLAIALAADPLLLVADEPTASLDATVAAEVLDLIDRLRRDRGLALLLITHDIAVAFRRADRAIVLYAGRVVERGPAALVFRSPRHPYTRALIASRPRLSDGGPGAAPFPSISGAVPALGERWSSSCAFAPRCPERFDACGESAPVLEPDEWERAMRCFLTPL
jgi:peptide/nickel transport system ATP-binding protein